MVPGTILGHEGVGIVEKVGRGVRNLNVGDRVVVPSTICCGYCAYCRAGYFAQCDSANPNGKDAGTAFFGGPKSSGPIQGLQAERARIPFSNANLVKLPEEVTDDQAILISDIFPTGYFAAEIAGLHECCVVTVFGCGPVGQFAIASCKLMGAGRVIAVDNVPSRLETARNQGAEVIDFDAEDPIEAIKELTGGIGSDRAIDAVGIDASHPRSRTENFGAEESDRPLKKRGSGREPEQPVQRAGDAPAQALEWAVQALAKAGTLSVVGVYPPQMDTFPIGKAMNKNLTLRMGNCNHRKYVPKLVEFVRAGVIDPTEVVTPLEPLGSAIDAYQAFDQHEPGWIKVELAPESLGVRKISRQSIRNVRSDEEGEAAAI